MAAEPWYKAHGARRQFEQSQVFTLYTIFGLILLAGTLLWLARPGTRHHIWSLIEKFPLACAERFVSLARFRSQDTFDVITRRAPRAPSAMYNRRSLATMEAPTAASVKAAGATTANLPDGLVAFEDCAAVLPGLHRRNDISLWVGFKPPMMTRTGIVEHFATGIGQGHRFLGLTPA